MKKKVECIADVIQQKPVISSTETVTLNSQNSNITNPYHKYNLYHLNIIWSFSTVKNAQASSDFTVPHKFYNFNVLQQ